MKTHLKKLGLRALCLVICFLSTIYASPASSSIKAYSLCQPSSGLSVCSQDEPCKDGDYEEILKKVCRCSCSPQESLRCVERNGKYLRFCYDNPVCLAGTYDKVLNIAGLDDKISLSVEECPDGYFQPHPDQCNKACRYRHIPKPSNMVQLHPGNASASEVAYCDSDNEWVSFNGHTFFNISHEPGSQMCIKSRDPCQNGTDLLPNGTCAVNCRSGFYRVPVDNFNCKPEVIQTSEETVIHTSNQDQGENEKGTENYQPTHDPTNTHGTPFVILMVIIAVVSVVVVAGIIVYFKRKRGNGIHQELHNPGPENGTLLGHEDSRQGKVTTIVKEKNVYHGCPIIKTKRLVLNKFGNTIDNSGDEEREGEETQAKEVA